MKRDYKRRFIIWMPAVLFFCSVAGMAAAREIDGFADWYGDYVYPMIVGILSRICGVLSVSVVEIGLYLLIIAGIWYIVSHIRQIKKILWTLACCVSILLFLYVFNCGINYSRTPFSTVAGLEIRESSQEELYSLCSYLTDQVAGAYEELERRENSAAKDESSGTNWPSLILGEGPLTWKEAWQLGEAGVKAMEKLGEIYPCSYLTDQVAGAYEELERRENSAAKDESSGTNWPSLILGEGPLTWKEAWQLGEAGVKAMEKLGEIYPSLSGFYPRPKPVGVSWILSVQQFSGIYSPFTAEANFNRQMTPYNIPHTICHELSHLKGFMREDEANFIGYLACIFADSLEYRYSGYLMGWIYATNALYEENPEAYFELAGRLPDRVNRALTANNRFWDQYEGKIAEAATQANDTYLKMNNQEEGVKSYGRVVDLMLAYYRFSL